MSNLVAYILDWDSYLVEGVALRRTTFLNRVMTEVTRLGDGWAWLLLGLCVLFLDSEHFTRFLVTLSMAMVIDIPIYAFMKQKFSRPRPFQVCGISCIRAPKDRFSFPSGHTSVAFAVFSVAGTIYSILMIPLGILAVLIGVSRVYLGVHYPSDVVAGAILGVLSGLLSLWML